MTKPPALSKYVLVDVSSARLNRIWASVSACLESQPRSPRRWWYSVAAAAFLAVSLTAIGWRLSLRSQPKSAFHRANLETAGDSLTVDLNDGSRLELAARSRLEVLAGDSRSAAVRLKRGTVVCDLVSRPERHFSVFAAEVEVRVTGTRFTVNLNPERNHVEVSVQRGSVTVVWPSGSEPNRRLTAGERWSIDRGQAQSSAANTVSIAPVSAPAGSTAESKSDASPTNGLNALGDRDQVATAAPVAIESPTARTLFDQGNAARRAGDTSGAARAYQNLLTKYPRDPRVGLAAFELGRLRMGPLSDIPGAIRAFQSAAVLASGSAFREDAMAHLVEAYSLSSQTGPCKSAREAYLREYPKGVHAALVGRQCGVK